MVTFRGNIPFNQDLAMLKSVNSTDPYIKLKQINQLYRKKNAQNQLNIPACEKSRSAVIDVIILIAVVSACGVLLYPYMKLLVQTSADFFEEAVYVFKDEIDQAPLVYACFGLSVLFALSALMAITLYTSRTCGKPSCRGLRKAAEFDIQLETEECVKSTTGVLGAGTKNGLVQLPRDHHRELEAELKKMAPPNGRAVLVFRARCGCPLGRLEVPGPKKMARKFKK